jgi:hypothetical protein
VLLPLRETDACVGFAVLRPAPKAMILAATGHNFSSPLPELESRGLNLDVIAGARLRQIVPAYELVSAQPRFGDLQAA